jgi:hypothetical protein
LAWGVKIIPWGRRPESDRLGIGVPLAATVTVTSRPEVTLNELALVITGGVVSPSKSSASPVTADALVWPPATSTRPPGSAVATPSALPTWSAPVEAHWRVAGS